MNYTLYTVGISSRFNMHMKKKKKKKKNMSVKNEKLVFRFKKNTSFLTEFLILYQNYFSIDLTKCNPPRNIHYLNLVNCIMLLKLLLITSCKSHYDFVEKLCLIFSDFGLSGNRSRLRLILI